MRSSNFHGLIALAAAAIALSACSQFEPFRRQGTWHENNAPMHNIAVELANPHDLYQGAAHPVLTGTMAETAIGGASAVIGGSGATAGGSTGSASAIGAGAAGAASGGIGGSAGGMGGGSGMGGGMGGSSGGGSSGMGS